MAEIPGINWKEAVEVVEARVPGGKFFVKIVLSLALLVAIIWLSHLVIDWAIKPTFHLFSFLFSTSQFHFTFDLANGVAWLSTLLVFVLFWRLLSRIISAMMRHIKLTSRQADQAGETIQIVYMLKETVTKVTKIIEELVSRVKALEEGRKSS